MLALQQKLNNRNRLITHLSCDEQTVPSLIPVVDRFVLGFEDKGPVIAKKRSYDAVSKGEVHEVQLYRLPSTVSYAAYALRTSARGSIEQAAQVLLGQILSGNDLWEVIRGQGGAYGVSATADVMEQVFVFSTYRDPRIIGSLSDFKRVLATYATEAVDAKHIENALISTVGSELKPLSPAQDSILSFRGCSTRSAMSSGSCAGSSCWAWTATSSTGEPWRCCSRPRWRFLCGVGWFPVAGS
jgi:Zn-dependent M16 (insulinase) family peptidase